MSETTETQQPLPPLEVKCDACNGTGRSCYERCWNCEGTGYALTDFGQQVLDMIERHATFKVSR